MRKLLFGLAKVCHIVCPNYILMNSLVFLKHVPILNKCVDFFDPNAIRKNVIFELTERVIFLRDKSWNLLVNSRDHIGFRSYIKNQPFEMSIYKLVPKISSSGRCIVIDIGANIGSASVPVCAKYGYQLLAIEASKSNLPLLARNVLNNELKAKILPYALVDQVRDDYIKLFINNGNTAANSLLEKWNPSLTTNKAKRFEYVPTKTFDQIIKEEKVDVGSVLITKIDVEGMEEAVLKGSIEFLAVNDAPIILEYRLDAVQKYQGKDMRGILDILERFDYSLYALTDEGSIMDFNPGRSYENIIAIKRGYEHDGLA
jgi:FkbM family methyltransferase